MQFEKVLEGIDDIAHEFNHGVEKKELCKQVVAQLYSYSGQQVCSQLHWQKETKTTPLWGMGLGWETVPGEARGRCSTTTLGVVRACPSFQGGLGARRLEAHSCTGRQIDRGGYKEPPNLVEGKTRDGEAQYWQA